MRRARSVAAGDRCDVCLAASHGGHLELLRALDEAYRERRHVFVTPPSVQADELRAGGRRVATVLNPGRSPLLLARNAVQALRIARRERPRVVVCSGADASAAFAVWAKLLGARLLFVETMARVHRGSATGRLLRPLADRILVQWPELLGSYPGAEVCRPALLEGIPASSPPGRGTFVALGTDRRPFDRLLRLVDRAAGAGLLPNPVVAQAGASRYAPRHVEAHERLPGDQFAAAIRDSEVVVCHGGSGTIALALRSGRVPLVLPRRRANGEHVDDHQLELVAKLAELGLAVSLDEHPIERALELGRRRPDPGALERLPGPPLARRLRELIAEALEWPRGRACRA